jgi:hypothetical protein
VFPLNELGRPARTVARWAITGAGLALLGNGCGTKSDRAPFGSPPIAGAAGRGASGSSGTSGSGGSGGRSSQPEGGLDAGGQGEGGRDDGAGADSGGKQNAAGASEGGATNTAGRAGVGEAGTGEAGAPGDVEPVPVPTCTPGVRFGSGRPLALSTADDDLLEGITPDELTLVFSAGGHFYVAERDSVTDDFGAPVEVAAGLGFGSLTVSSDGLRLIGAGASGFAELARPARTETFGDEPNDADFVPFNAAVQGTPTDESALEPLLAMDDTLLVYSFVSPSNEGARPTLYASEWLGQWSFGQPLLGAERLWASGQARRVATGVSSDGLTLFYRDEVAGEFRRAWRRRLSEEFDAFESLGDWERAAPNAACDELYYSAQNEGSVDLFVAGARPADSE